MSDYAIGDIQGCYDALQRLLAHIGFNAHEDRLWFVGDLVNRGPDSLAVLRFIRGLPIPAKITLGNHDLHLLNLLFGENPWRGADDTLDDVLMAPDAQELGHWLRQQSILCLAPEHNSVLCHAGIAPMWDLPQAIALARELEQVLSGPNYREFLTHMYGNKPDIWSEHLTGGDRLRAITNYFTRMRYCDEEGRLQLEYKGRIEDAHATLYPWYATPNRKAIAPDIIFGHWASLMGITTNPKLYALDTGCLWGGPLTALRMHDKQIFSVPGYRNR